MFTMPQQIDLSLNPLTSLYELGEGHDYAFFKMGKRDVFFVNAPDLIQWAFTHKSIGRGRFFKIFSRWLGNGLLASEGESHRAMRRELLPAFNAEAQKIYMQTIIRDAPILLDEWRDGEMDLAGALFDLVFQVTVRAVYGLNQLTPQNTQELLNILAHGSESFLGRAALPEGHYLASGRVRHPIVDEALEYMGAHWQPTPLTRILDSLPAQEKYDQTLTMLSASLDTSMAALVWMFHLFSRSPTAFDSFCEDACTRPLEEAAHGYASLALHETLRLFPTGGWLNTRELFRPLSIRGCDLPAGINIFISSWVTHRDVRYFDSPKEFQPERFKNQIAPWTYFPFGSGAHTCMGRPFSLAELPYLAALVVQTFDIQFLQGNDIQLRLRIGLTPDGQIPVKVQKRGG
ncbi:MAG: cytochrome P450 [Chloroflexi bacterium]|nr:cytochrome P450 [Chloroflexota bacterium]